MTMEDKFLFLNSIGQYGEISNVERQSVPGTDSDHTRRCEVMKTECDRMQYDHQESSPDLIVKVEPEEDLSRWGPPLPRDRILLSGAQPGASLGISMYAAPSNRFSVDRQRRPPGTALSRPTRRESARFLEKERLRNVKFSDRENNVLVMEISENYEKILGRLMTATPVAEKREIWRDIVVAVNSVSHHTRTVAQCKKRYSDIKKKVKEKLSKQRAGKQVNVFFWPYEKHMLSLMSSKMALSLNGEADSPTMSDEDDSIHTLTPCEALPIRCSVNDGGQKEDITQTYEAKEDMAEDTKIYRAKEDMAEDTKIYRAKEDMAEDTKVYQAKEDMAEATSLAATEKCEPYSDADQDGQENGDISEAQCDSQQSGSDPSQNDPDPHQANVTLERSLRHLSGCIKAQTATLRQTNVILRNLSTNMQNGFQQLVDIIQQAASMARPDHQLGTTAQPSTPSTCTSGHIGRGRRGRGRHPLTSTPAKKSRGKS